MKRYQFHFSFLMLAAILLQQVPGILRLFFPPLFDPLASNSTPWPVLDIIENGSLVLIFFSLLLLKHKEGAGKHANRYGLPAIVSIACYFVLWLFYFNGFAPGWCLVGLAVAPALYYVFLSLRQRNGVALVFCVLFALTHIPITVSNYLF